MEPEPHKVMHRAEFWQVMRDCLSKLPEKIRAVFTMCEMDGVPSKEELVANDAREIHRQTHAEVQGNGSDTLAIHGRADAADEVDQEAAALFDLLLVPALRRTASLYASHSTPVSRARRRSVARPIFSRSAGTYQAEAGGKRSLGSTRL